MNNNFDICYIISHGFAARMVIQTNLLGKIIDQGYSVAVISPDTTDQVLRNYCLDKGIVLFQFKPSSDKWNSNYIRKRRYLFEKIKKNPALLEKHIYELKYSKIRNPIKRFLPLYWMFLHRVVINIPSIQKKYIKKEQKLLDSQVAKELLIRINPKKLISTYPVSLAEAQLLYSANKIISIQTWIHLLSWDNITSKGRFPALAEKFIAWGPIMVEELQKFYDVEKSNIYSCGVPHFDLHYRIKNSNEDISLKGFNLKENIPTIFFGMSSPRFAPFEIDIVENLAKKIENNKLDIKLQLIIRPHPQNVKGNMADLSWLPRLKKLNNYKKVYVDFPELIESRLSWSMGIEDMKKLSKLIAISSIVINSGSTISIDALYHGKPVILTSFDGPRKLNYWKSARRLVDYTHLKKMIAFGGIEKAYSQDELEILIKKYVDDPNLKMKQRKETLHNELSDISGQSTKKIVERLIHDGVKKSN